MEGANSDRVPDASNVQPEVRKDWIKTGAAIDGDPFEDDAGV